MSSAEDSARPAPGRDQAASGRQLQIALVLYPGFTALDIVGPHQVLASVPQHDVAFVAAQVGPVTDDTGRCQLIASTPFEEISAPDVVVIGGTLFDPEPDKSIVEWLRAVHPTTTWTTSVCTGSICLAAAGILNGIDATTHWARIAELERHGARYLAERVVQRGKVMTAAGVSAGIDMALTLVDRLHGPQLAQAVQLGLEYDPHPPFDTGSPAKAPREMVEFVRARLDLSELDRPPRAG
jgi:transcriptional regulator GlxA family with amidase domain